MECFGDSWGVMHECRVGATLDCMRERGTCIFIFLFQCVIWGTNHTLSKESKTRKDNLNLPWSKLRRKWPSLGGSGQAWEEVAKIMRGCPQKHGI